MNIPSWKIRLSGEVSEYLDSDTETLAESSDNATSTNTRDDKYIADLQLVDALLISTTPSVVERQNDLIEVAMRTLFGSASSPIRESSAKSPPRADAIRRSVWAIAACLAVAITIFWVKGIREAHAIESVLLEIATAASTGEERVYKVSRQSLDTDESFHPIGDLYLKGSEAFVLDCTDVVLGRNGNEFWLVSPHDEVVVASNFNWLIGNSQQQQHELAILREISVASGRVSLVDLSMVSELLRHEYSLELQRSRDTTNRSTTQLIGTRNSTNSELPSAIWLWADSETFIVERAEFSWSGNESGDSLVAMKLIDSRTVQNDWYRRESHHPSDQPIRFLPPRE